MASVTTTWTWGVGGGEEGQHGEGAGGLGRGRSGACIKCVAIVGKAASRCCCPGMHVSASLPFQTRASLTRVPPATHPPPHTLRRLSAFCSLGSFCIEARASSSARSFCGRWAGGRDGEGRGGQQMTRQGATPARGSTAPARHQVEATAAAPALPPPVSRRPTHPPAPSWPGPSCCPTPAPCAPPAQHAAHARPCATPPAGRHRHRAPPASAGACSRRRSPAGQRTRRQAAWRAAHGRLHGGKRGWCECVCGGGVGGRHQRSWQGERGASARLAVAAGHAAAASSLQRSRRPRPTRLTLLHASSLVQLALHPSPQDCEATLIGHLQGQGKTR